MPLIRFLLFASGFIICGFFASDYLVASRTSQHSETAQTSQSSLADWRNAEARKRGLSPEAAIVLPAAPQSAPTSERLAFERQLASNTVPAPAWAQSESGSLANARAQMTEATPQQPAPQSAAASKPKRKPIPRPELATAERAPAPRGFGGFFGGIFN